MRENLTLWWWQPKERRRQQPRSRSVPEVTPINLMAPYVSSSDTSKAAAHSVRGDLQAMEKKVYSALWDAGMDGMTCDAVEVAIGMSHQSCSARIRGLAKLGRIIDTGRRAPTRSGRSAVVWAVAI